mgnify:CR=1 FL=1
MKKSSRFSRGLVVGILSVMLPVSFLTATAFAADGMPTEVGDGVICTYSDADSNNKYELVISGSGEIKADIFKDKTNIESVVIEEGVTGIGSKA